MDLLKAYYDFASNVAKALDAAGVKPLDDDKTMISAVMVMVAGHNGDRPTTQPIGGGLNYIKETGKWEVQIEVQEATPLAEDGEPA